MELILKENKEEAWSRIDNKIIGVLESQTQRSIYRVHDRYLRGTNDKTYKPAVVAIGPYHRGSEGLQMMEEHKVRCLKSLHLRNNQTVERCISAAAEMEVKARDCYAEAISLSAAEFIEMLVLDGCFILHLLKMYQDSTTDDVVVDPIFKMEWVVHCLQRDIILFENQIPFFVLCKLFDLIEAPNQHENLVEMFSLFSGMGEITYSRWDNRSPREVKHLLHLMHIIWGFRSPAPYYRPLERYFQRIPTATQLKYANVEFIASESDDSRVFQFDKGQLTISPLSIADGTTEILLSNLIVYEQYFPDNKPAFITDYALVFDCLVKTRRDVEILSECGIIHNTMGDNQQAADIINRLTHSVPLSPNFFIYGNTFQSINAHYYNRWNRARGFLSRDYFHNPWAYISFDAALILLLLTLAQTVFSALQLL